MDPEQHQRFLDYLERYEYFGRGDPPRLTREEFEAIDLEFQRLHALQRRGPTEEETHRELTTLLLRD